MNLDRGSYVVPVDKSRSIGINVKQTYDDDPLCMCYSLEALNEYNTKHPTASVFITTYGRAVEFDYTVISAVPGVFQ